MLGYKCRKYRIQRVLKKQTLTLKMIYHSGQNDEFIIFVKYFIDKCIFKDLNDFLYWWFVFHCKVFLFYLLSDAFVL